MLYQTSKLNLCIHLALAKAICYQPHREKVMGSSGILHIKHTEGKMAKFLKEEKKRKKRKKEKKRNEAEKYAKAK